MQLSLHTAELHKETGDYFACCEVAVAATESTALEESQIWISHQLVAGNRKLSRRPEQYSKYIIQ